MDDKIIEELDNLDVKDAEQLLDSIETIELDEKIDKETVNKIKASVLEKAGLGQKIQNKLIPNKITFFARCMVITVFELLFFISSAFVAWMEGFLSVISIKPVFGGIMPFILYIFLFSFMVLFIYIAMYNIDSDSFNIKDFFPKNRTFIGYLFYMYLSGALRIFIFLVLSLMIGELLFSPFIVVVLPIYLVIFVSLDMLLFNIKNFFILQYQIFYSYYYEWQFDRKTFMIELLKYAGIIAFIFALEFLSLIGNSYENSRIVTFLVGFVLLWIANSFFTFIVLMKKRHYQKINPPVPGDKGNTEPYDKTPLAVISKKWIYFKQRTLVFGVLAIACLYAVGIAVPYISHISLKPEKPLMQSFSSRNEVTDYFSDESHSFSSSSRYASINEFTEFLFLFNKMFIGIVNLKPYTPFSGVVANSRSKASYHLEPTKAFSDTNTQLENVDEADVIKTDGKYVYYLNNSKLFIVQANPPEQIKIIYQHDFSGEKLYPLELFLYRQHIAVILTDDSEYKGKDSASKTIVKTYNVKDPYTPVLERNFKLDYTYLTSRMVENNLYLVTTSFIFDMPGNPSYIDSSASDSIVDMDYNNLFLMCNSTSNRYAKMNVVTALPVDEPVRKAQVKAYIGGDGENAYVSTDYIYIADSAANSVIDAPLGDFFDNLSTDDHDLDYQKKHGTNIYRIEIQDGVIGGFGSAFVPGRVHNQFSMDEYNGYFRLTTQTGNWQYASSNVYVLDENMKLCGALEGLAPEEHIFASRFMGDRLYLVTFKQVDPLFVISLKDPQKPTVLGKLKIPGYSEYIHPLDANHIIGFGKDTAGGNEDFSWYQGIKMAVFDITDVNNPKEKFVEIIGDRGTDSELLRNHKALMYMKNLELMAFPVTLAKTPEGVPDEAYGKYVFQGAYVYNVSSTEGFKLRGRITHLKLQSEDIYLDPYNDRNNAFINRIIYANDALYTFSGNKVKATQYSDMQDISEVLLR